MKRKQSLASKRAPSHARTESTQNQEGVRACKRVRAHVCVRVPTCLRSAAHGAMGHAAIGQRGYHSPLGTSMAARATWPIQATTPSLKAHKKSKPHLGHSGLFTLQTTSSSALNSLAS